MVVAERSALSAFAPWRTACAAAASVGLAASASAQDSNADQSSSAVFVTQAPESGEGTASSDAATATSSKVYFPDAITPESVAAARVRSAEQEQLARERQNSVVAQLTRQSEGQQEVGQLSDGDGARALDQLSEAERQVLLDAVEGTDICERASQIPAIQTLCEERIETRSEEFATSRRNRLSAEERLLGEGLNGREISTLQSAIVRLSRNASDVDEPSNQAIASVALSGSPVATGVATGEESNPAGDLSPETQSLIEAIVDQFGGNTGG